MGAAAIDAGKLPEAHQRIPTLEALCRVTLRHIDTQTDAHAELALKRQT